MVPSQCVCSCLFVSPLLTMPSFLLLSSFLSPSLLLPHTPLYTLLHTFSHPPPSSSSLPPPSPLTHTALADVVDSYTLGGPQPGQTAPVALTLSLDIVVEVRTVQIRTLRSERLGCVCRCCCCCYCCCCCCW